MTKSTRLRTGTTLVIAATLIGLLWVSSTFAGTRIYVQIAPPVPIVETVPVAPSPAHVWIAGYHRWDGRAYVWVPGHYVVPPHAHWHWVAGHWSHHHAHGYYWVEGHWRH